MYYLEFLPSLIWNQVVTLNILPDSVAPLLLGQTDDRAEATLAVCGSALKGYCMTPTSRTITSQSLPMLRIIRTVTTLKTCSTEVNVAAHIKLFFFVLIINACANTASFKAGIIE